MSIRRTSAVFAAAALMSAVAGSAWAADKVSKPVDFTVRAEPVGSAPDSPRATKLDASKGRFGFTLDMQQPDGRQATPNDVSAGAYFRITPSLRVGGAVALGEQDLTPRRNQSRPADQPKVRVETKFKF